MGTVTSKKDFQDKSLAGNHSMAAARSNGLAIAAPAYGVESLDQALLETTSEQYQPTGTAIQMKAGLSAGGGEGGSGPQNLTGLPDGLKSGVESLSGLSLDDVRVHFNSSKPAQLQALAYAQGTDIHVGPGQERHLPHEAWHVVQQKQGRVGPTRQVKAARINDDTGLEKEADRMGVKALRMPRSNPISASPMEKNPHLPQGNLLNAPVQRKMGLELEVPVPIDNLGVLTETDKKVISGEKKDESRLQELYSASDAGYGKFGSYRRIALHADHSSRVLPDKSVYPLRVMGRSILEMVFDPPVETQEELDLTMKDLTSFMSAINTETDGLKKRKELKGGLHIGPMDGSTKPPELGWNAMIHVNIGIDPRRLHSMLSWYSASKYKPASDIKQIPMEYARDVAEQVVKAFSEGSKVSNEDAQFWNGLRGLTMIYVMYLLSGGDKSELKSSVKNFATLLTKTRFEDIKAYGLTPKEKEWLDGAWEDYKKVLIGMTRPKEDESSSLVLRTNKKGQLKDGSWKIGDLFGNTPPILLGKDKEIRADDVGPVRTDQDKVTGGGKRRKGMVLEFRSLPGRYPPSEWAGLAKDFLDKANEENAVKDYTEKPPVKKVEKEKEIAVLPGKMEVLKLPLPVIKPKKKENIVVEQTAEFWTVDKEVKWENALWKVIKKEGIKKYTLSFIKDL